MKHKAERYFGEKLGCDATEAAATIATPVQPPLSTGKTSSAILIQYNFLGDIDGCLNAIRTEKRKPRNGRARPSQTVPKVVAPTIGGKVVPRTGPLEPEPVITRSSSRRATTPGSDAFFTDSPESDHSTSAKLVTPAGVKKRKIVFSEDSQRKKRGTPSRHMETPVSRTSSPSGSLDENRFEKSNSPDHPIHYTRSQSGEEMDLAGVLLGLRSPSVSRQASFDSEPELSAPPSAHRLPAPAELGLLEAQPIGPFAKRSRSDSIQLNPLPRSMMVQASPETHDTQSGVVGEVGSVVKPPRVSLEPTSLPPLPMEFSDEKLLRRVCSLEDDCKSLARVFGDDMADDSASTPLCETPLQKISILEKQVRLRTQSPF